MSNARHTLSRDQVLVAYAADQIARLNFSEPAFAQALNRALYDKCPVKAQEKDVPDFEADLLRNDAGEFMKATSRWLKRVQRWLDGSVELPVWLEEAWIVALEPDWRERCVNELAGRHGLIGARALGGDACPVTAFAQLVTRLGQAVEAGSEVLADGKIDAADLPQLPEFIQRLRAVEARTAELRHRAEEELAKHTSGSPLKVVG
ncbi:hypothetical protein ACUTAH_02820 [Metapseudomonas furukawaii]|uniref:hypothetical protein n=1 Tax=Metapseudomonas furukawaii TaxID=1149133 RepID=UPI0040465F62